MRTTLLLCLLTTCCLAAWVPVQATTAPVLATVSLSPTGVLANGYSDTPAISGDGRYVVFAATSSNLTGDNPGGIYVIYVRDLHTGLTTCISKGPGGVMPNANCSYPSLSGDGRYVAFMSRATNLVAGVSGSIFRIYLYDTVTHVLSLVTTGLGGVSVDDMCQNPRLSADGHYLVYMSNATNLVAGDTNGWCDIFRYDVTTGTTIRVNIPAGGGQATGGNSYTPAINADGTRIVFYSYATNLTAAGGNGQCQVYLRNMTAGTTVCLSTTAGGQLGNGGSCGPTISADGTRVAFESDATNLVTGDTNGARDIFTRTVATAASIARASVATDGTEADGWSYNATLTADGTRVTFDSEAANLDARDPNTNYDVYLHDCGTGATTCLSVTAAGLAGNSVSFSPRVDAAGRYVVFVSYASNLTPQGGNAYGQVLCGDLAPVAPVVDGQTLTTPENTALPITLTAGTSHRDFLTYQVTDGPQHGTLTGTAPNLTYTPTTNYHGPDSVTVTASEGTLTGTAGSINITVIPLNHPPTDLTLSNANVAENQPVGTTVGTLATTDPDADNTFTYTLVSGTGSTDNASFTITGNTLQTAASFNYEAKNSYSIRLRSTDQGGLYVEKACTIGVTDVNEAPTDISLSNTSIAENQPAGTTVGTLSTTDPDAAQTFTYTLVDGTGSTDNACFALTGNALKTAAILDYETKSTLAIRVRSTDQNGAWVEKAFTVSVTDVNDAPTDILLSNASVAENQPAGTVVGIFSAIDPDSAHTAQTCTYSLVTGNGDTDNGSFTVDSIPRVWSLVPYNAHTWILLSWFRDASAVPPLQSFTAKETGELQAFQLYWGGDYNNALNHDAFTIEIRAGEGLTGTLLATASYDLTVNGWITCTLPPGVLVTAGQRYSIVFTSITGNPQMSATIQATSADGYIEGEFIHPLITDNRRDLALQTIIGGGRLQTAASFEYETKHNYSIRVRATDQDGASVEKAFTVTVTDVNEAPTDITLSNAGIAENQPTGTAVGTLSTTDPDADNTFTYALVAGTGSTDNASFTITGNTLKTATAFDYEWQTSYAIRVRATDNGTPALSCEKTFTVTVTDVNDPRVLGTVSLSPTGALAGNASDAPVISADGRYVAFTSLAGNLTGDTPAGYSAVFLRDLHTGITTCISKGPGGVMPNGNCLRLSISGDGRYVAFDSSATNLAAGITTTRSRVYLYDAVTRTLALVTIGIGGVTVNGACSYAKLSADGHYLAYQSDASNLVNGDTNGVNDIFRYAVSTGATERVNLSTGGEQTTGVGSYRPAISGDGSRIVFYSAATNLTALGGNGYYQIYLRDLTAATTTCMSVTPGGQLGNAASSQPAISANGTHVAFLSQATNVIANDPSDAMHVYVRAVNDANSLVRASVASNGTAANGYSYLPSLSADGARVVFYSEASNLDVRDPNSTNDVYLHDRTTGITTCLSVNAAGQVGDNGSQNQQLAAGGRYVVFQSTAGNLTRHGGNSYGQMLLCDLAPTAPAIDCQKLTTAEDTALPITLTAGESAIDLFSYEILTGPQHGTLTGTTPYLTYTPAANYSGADSFTVTASEGPLAGTAGTISLTVTPVNDPPTDLTLTNAILAENRPAGTTVGTLATTDPDAGNTFTYTLVTGAGSGDNASFTISDNALQTALLFDYEAKTSYSIRVRSTDSGDPAQSFEKAFTITVTDTTEPPTDILLSNDTIAEHLPGTTVVGTLSTLDQDNPMDGFIYTLVAGEGSGDNAYFYINRISATDVVADYRPGYTYVDDVAQTPAPWQCFTATKTGMLKSVRIASYSSDDAGVTVVIREGRGMEGRVLASVTTPFGGNYWHTVSMPNTVPVVAGHEYTLVLTNPTGTSCKFYFTASLAIDNYPGGFLWQPTLAYRYAYGGALDMLLYTEVWTATELRTPYTFNYETKSAYHIRLRSTDLDAEWYEKPFTIHITNVNEAPTDITLSNTSMAEHQPIGTVMGTLATADPDSAGTPQTFTYTLVDGEGGEDNASFTVAGNQLQAAVLFDVLVNNSYQLRVRSTDQDGLYIEKAFTMTVRNLQPDLMVKTAAAGSYIGEHVYNTEQIASQTVHTGVTATYNVVLGNDGELDDTLTLTGSASAGGWTVRYFDARAGGGEITGDVTTGGWPVGPLAAGATVPLRIEVTGDGTVRGGIANTVQLTASSSTDGRDTDTVKAVTTKAALGTPTLTGTPGSPTATGIKVKLTASVSGGGATQLAFRYRLTTTLTYTALLPYGSATTCDWTPAVAGNYFVQVLAREVGSTAEYDTYRTLSYTVKPAITAVDLTSSLPSPTVTGMPVRFTATPTGGANLRYWFRYKLSTAATWTDLQPYGTSTTCTWTPVATGTYMVQVLVQEVGSTNPLCDVYKVVNYTVKTPLTAVSLASNPATSGLVGAVVRLVALPTGGGTVQYWFRAKRSVDAGWTDIQAYATTNICYWMPTNSGAYTVQVLARECGKTTLYDVNKVIAYTARYAVATVDLTTSPVSPVVVGTTVTLTASSTGSTSPHYWFRVMYGSTWTDLQAYSATPTCDWTPTRAGTYTVEVLARDSRSTRAYDVVKIISFAVRAAP